MLKTLENKGAAVEAVDADFFAPVNSTTLIRTLNRLIG